MPAKHFKPKTPGFRDYAHNDPVKTPGFRDYARNDPVEAPGFRDYARNDPVEAPGFRDYARNDPVEATAPRGASLSCCAQSQHPEMPTRCQRPIYWRRPIGLEDRGDGVSQIIDIARVDAGHVNPRGTEHIHAVLLP